MSAQFRDDDRSIEALRVPPQSHEAEQAVIGAVMLVPACLAQVGDLLTAEDFYRRTHQTIWRAICALDDAQQPLDVVTVGEYLETHGQAEQAGGVGYVIELASTTPSAANVIAYARIVREKAILRRLIEAGTEIVNLGFRPDARKADEILGEAQKRLNGVTDTTADSGPELPRSGLKAWFEGLSIRYDSDEELTGLSTPWAAWDDLTCGLQPATLIVLAARPGMGKTIAGEGVSTHVAKVHGPSALFELEMQRDQLLQRSVASRGQVPHDWLRSPKKYERKHEYFDSAGCWGKVSSAIRELRDLPLLIDDTGGLSVEQIVARARRLKAKFPALKLLVIDHLHIIRLPGRGNKSDEIGEVTRRLKALAKELGIPVLLLAQLNRALKDRTDKRPTMTDLRASGDIEQDADEVWFLHREDYYHRDTHLRGVVELINGKARNAPAGETINLRNRFDQMRLESWDGPLPESPTGDAPARGRWGRSGTDSRTRAAGDA